LLFSVLFSRKSAEGKYKQTSKHSFATDGKMCTYERTRLIIIHSFFGNRKCLCRCTWSSGWCRLVTFRLRFDSHCGSFACNLEQVANLLCAQVNSPSYPQPNGLRGEGLVWLIGAVVCLLAANRGSNCSLTRAMDGRVVRCGIISSCQSAATSETVKRFWSRV